MTVDVREKATLRGEPFDVGDLTAVGVSEDYLLKAALDLTFQFRVRDIVTNAVVRAEGSLDGREWYNLDAGDEDYTLTADGIYAMTYRGYVSFTRFNFVSLSGGAPTIRNIKLLIGIIS